VQLDASRLQSDLKSAGRKAIGIHIPLWAPIYLRYVLQSISLNELRNFRKLLVNFEKTETSFIALLHLAAGLICLRQTVSIYE
jgi:hypothetical protein